MALYSIENDTCLGISHSGAVNVESEGYVELSDEEVVKIVELIRKEGTTDIEELRLEELYPDIYKKLRDAYYDMAYNEAKKLIELLEENKDKLKEFTDKYFNKMLRE